MTRTIIWAALAIAAFATPALTQAVGGAPSAVTVPTTPTSSPATPTPALPHGASKDPGQQVICKQQDEIGSRLGGKRICMTKAQWAQQTQDAHDSADYLQRGTGLSQVQGR
jgi:hypothetical protein